MEDYCCTAPIFEEVGLPAEGNLAGAAFRDEDLVRQNPALATAEDFFARHPDCAPALQDDASERLEPPITATVVLEGLPLQPLASSVEAVAAAAASAAAAAAAVAAAGSSPARAAPMPHQLTQQHAGSAVGINSVLAHPPPAVQHSIQLRHGAAVHHHPPPHYQQQPPNRQAYPQQVHQHNTQQRSALRATARANAANNTYGWGSERNTACPDDGRRGRNHGRTSSFDNGWEGHAERYGDAKPSVFQTAAQVKRADDKLGRGGKAGSNGNWKGQRNARSMYEDVNMEDKEEEEEEHPFERNSYLARLPKRKFAIPKPTNEEGPGAGGANSVGRPAKQKYGGGGGGGGYGQNNPAAPPFAVAPKSNGSGKNSGGASASGGGSGGSGGTGGGEDDGAELPEKLKGCDPKLIEQIENEIVDRGHPISFDDIAGLQEAKQSVFELVCWPMKRPDLFTGLRSLPKGLLLFGPPGTGKTLIGKAIAHESGATFFSISASSLMSKWTGESERLVKTLFAVASHREPSVVFIDEVDSLLTARSSDENEASRRLKTEFLVQLDGAATPNDRVLVVGATNRPHELDEAARRRFVKKLYIPLPEEEGRRDLVRNLLSKNTNTVADTKVEEIVRRTAGFSGADLRSLCTEAAMGPIRDSSRSINRIHESQLPPISFKHFTTALRSVRPSVAQKDLNLYIKWNVEFGTFHRGDDEEEDDEDKDEHNSSSSSSSSNDNDEASSNNG
jgi:AAA+ superfamily predicted ATPase